MKTIKVSEATGHALDWLVAKCEEASGRDNAETWLRDYRIGFSTRYSTTWSQGGTIIEAEGIHLLCNDDQTEWLASAPHSNPRLVGWKSIHMGQPHSLQPCVFM